LNDLDLAWLTSRFDRITLVDLDAEAMRDGLERQLGAAEVDGVNLIALDVTGTYDLLSRLLGKEGGPTTEDVRSIQERLSGCPAVDALGQFDCVVSTCLLSQLIDGVKHAVGEDHPQFLPLVQAVRRQHLATILGMTGRGGLSVLIFDFVSNMTCPDLDQISDTDLVAFAGVQIVRRNFFTGLNPAVVLDALRSFQPREGFLYPPLLVSPWRWNLGPRQYLVAAVLARLA